MSASVRWLSGRRLLALAATAVAILVALYVWALPALAARVADRIPLEWEEQLGAGLVEALAPPETQCTEPERLEALERIVERLVASSDVGGYEFRVSLVDDTLVNALAAPGGYIVVFQGLLSQAETPEVVAGVLAHEIQHVVQRHGMSAVLKDLPMILAATVISGGNETAGSLLGATAALGSLRYRRGDEAEADREGLEMLRAARISPDGMIGFFATLAESETETSGLATYLSTHPRSEDRMETLRQLAAASPYTAEPLLEDVDWSRMRASCDGP
ncbi:MAG TPA: M48 family metallopeptidase [Longimicrobiales bacterium]|nr:M48 family metallopeptidase [Longimicrobiales bacterium]